ncbi:MAG: hypothetical protein LBE27_00295 [Deltaproteobacteria bacterium]|jgi:hypothetical protein|nr:hypothetical protein [Deltaproteobacteria bacterium]
MNDFWNENLEHLSNGLLKILEEDKLETAFRIGYCYGYLTSRPEKWHLAPDIKAHFLKNIKNGCNYGIVKLGDCPLCREFWVGLDEQKLDDAIWKGFEKGYLEPGKKVINGKMSIWYFKRKWAQLSKGLRAKAAKKK